jgi:hypothetical protein
MFGRQQQRDDDEQRDLEYDALQSLLVWRRLYRDLRDNAAFEDVFSAIETTSSIFYAEDMEK